MKHYLRRKRADSYETSGTVPGYVEVNTTTRAITIRPENTHIGDDEFIWRARNTHGSADLTVNITVTSLVETQSAYRASQTAPLFDAVASGTPDNWSSSEIPWTDAAPRVWSIQRTRPSGGPWSEWGTLEKHSERPAASETFYRRASSAPSMPGPQTGTTLSTPSAWQTTPPTATASEGVWRTTANRPQAIDNGSSRRQRRRHRLVPRPSMRTGLRRPRRCLTRSPPVRPIIGRPVRFLGQMPPPEYGASSARDPRAAPGVSGAP